MDNQPNEASIAWREWGDAAFESSLTERKPVLLALTATWCHWCHVMDQTSYSDSRVVQSINSGFIPIRVDVDQRPDLSSRYNQGGYPSLVFLDSAGAVIEGKIYVPPDDMIQLLDKIRACYPNASQKGLPTEPAIDTSQVHNGRPPHLVRQKIDDLYDPIYGGFGDEPKQPPWEGIGYLLSEYQRTGERRLRNMACRTLDGIFNGLYDNRDGGFFRYSVTRDWRVPHYEKMLVTNARLASAFLTAYQITRRTAYKTAAAGAIKYMTETLLDPATGLFWASQDAEEEYYGLPWKDRESTVKPSIDTTVYTGWNAIAAGAIFHFSGVVGSTSHLKRAEYVLETLWEEFESNNGLGHILGESRDQPRYLADHVYAFGAYLDMHQISGSGENLRRAQSLLDSIHQLFSDPSGGFNDVSRGNTPVHGIKPVLENALLAEGLTKLAAITGRDEHQTTAKNTLEALGSVVPGRSYMGPLGFRRMEEDEEKLFLPAGFAWTRVWDGIEGGMVHIVVVGAKTDKATKGLFGAAVRLRTPGMVIQNLDPETDAGMVRQLGFPVSAPPAAYLCIGTQCLPPIRHPAELLKSIRQGDMPGSL